MNPTIGPVRRPSIVALEGLAIYVAIVVAVLVTGHGFGHPEVFARFGDITAVRSGAQATFGPDLVIQPGQGHDGAIFWVQARDPLLLDPGSVQSRVQSPGARSLRMLYPLVAAPWGVGGEHSVLWGLLVTNLAVVAAGCFVAARLSLDLGGPAQAGLAFALNPTVLFATVMDLSDALMVLFVVGFVALVHRGRFGWAILAAVLAALTKESSLVAIAGVALLAPRLPRWFRVASVGAAGAAVVLWSAYSRWRLDWATDTLNAFAVVPFSGFVEAARFGWIAENRWAEGLIGIAVMVGGAAILVRWFRRRNLLMAAAGTPMLVLPLYTSEVFRSYTDSTRALGASLTLVAIDIAVERARRGRDDGGEPRPDDDWSVAPGRV